MSHLIPVTLLLLITRHGDSYFLVSEPVSTPKTQAPSAGDGWWRRIKHMVHEAYDSLRRRFDYQENVCATLRHASRITLLHSSAINREIALSRLRLFSEDRLRRHRKWMAIDCGLALLGSLLTPIPGPNVFFLYPAARTLSHFFAYRGIQRAQALGIAESMIDPLLSRVQENIENLDVVGSEVKELERTHNIHHLRSLLEKL